jgi:hypothetical protein
MAAASSSSSSSSSPSLLASHVRDLLMYQTKVVGQRNYVRELAEGEWGLDVVLCGVHDCLVDPYGAGDQRPECKICSSSSSAPLPFAIRQETLRDLPNGPPAIQRLLDGYIRTRDAITQHEEAAKHRQRANMYSTEVPPALRTAERVAFLELSAVLFEFVRPRLLAAVKSKYHREYHTLCMRYCELRAVRGGKTGPGGGIVPRTWCSTHDRFGDKVHLLPVQPPYELACGACACPPTQARSKPVVFQRVDMVERKSMMQE